MKLKVLIVEDQFVEANDVSLMLSKAGYIVSGIARSVSIALELIKKDKPDLVLVDIFLKGKLTGIDLAAILKSENIAFIYLSANSNEEILSAAKTTEPYGFIVKPFREKDLLVTLEIARYKYEHGLESKYRNEAELEKQLTAIITDTASPEQKLLKIGAVLQTCIPFDYLTAGFDALGKIAGSGTSFLRIGFNEYQTIGINELVKITRKSTDTLIAHLSHNPKEISTAFYNNEAFEEVCKASSLKELFADNFRMKSHLSFPLNLSDEAMFSFGFYSKRTDAYTTQHIDLCHRLSYLVTNSIKTMPASQIKNVAATDVKMAKEKDRTAQLPAFETIIGSSHLLLNVFDLVTQVAPVDTSVLILGESGTGKENIAACIHKLSPRKNKPFIKVNCAALPSTLIESELFGHEKGAFTGAIDKRTGKFEQAIGGTIFLDEIGEMPIDMQVKLLRVLQEKEIEPIGGKAPFKIDVRIIAATNRNLEKEVAEGRFRLDLYYRLNVFPITLPALRERAEDIPALIDYFIEVYNRKAGKRVTGVSEKVQKSLAAYHWPGNIRELEHLIERSVMLAKGNLIEDMAIPLQRNVSHNNKEEQTKSMFENEREYIISILKKSNGRIWGIGGAAELLKLPPTTLTSKMKKLGIKKAFIE